MKDNRITALVMSTYAVATLGAVVRLTRFVTLDDLGHWFIKGPVQTAAYDHDTAKYGKDEVSEDGHITVRRYPAEWDWDRPETLPTAMRASHGLDCPYCVSTWLGIGATALALVAWPHKRTRAAWFAIAGGLTASYITGHLIEKLDEEET